MPVESQLSHRNVRAANLPYVSLVSPTATDPCYVPGSQDILTSIKGYAERRPGFANVDASGFNNLQRIFTWDRFDGTFIKMYCDVNASGFAQVYKWVIGVDSAPVSIFTDTVGTPFDFVVSNNTVYFSNGNVAKKWDPINGISNWGIAIGSVNSATGPNTTTSGTNSGAGVAWTNPGDVTGAVGFATVALSATAPGASSSQQLVCNTFGFGLSAGTTITGVEIIATFNTSWGSNINHTEQLTFQLLKGGVPVGTPKSLRSGSAGTLTLGSSSDLWGTTFTTTDINSATWGVEIQGLVTASTGSVNATFTVQNVNATIFGLGGPGITVSASAGTFSATVGYQYVFCYGNSNTGHVSSPTPVSASTGIFTNKLNVQVSLTASTDPQVNQIRVFRSTDSVASGSTGGIFFEIPTSPYANTKANITDNAADNALNQYSIAPVPGFNDPPTPNRGAVYFSGRIWGFAGNKVYFSGLEEITIGVPEESWVSGVGGNFWAFDQPIQGLAVAGSANGQTLCILSGGRIYGIVGNSLDTFRRFTITIRHGCRSLTAVANLGALVAWLDSSGQIWGTDGTNLQELGQAIRPDTAALTPSSVSMTFHVAGNFHWLVVSTGTNLLVYDMDTEQWMPPWSFAAQYVFSGETSPGNYQLFAATATKSLTLSTVNHNDNGSFYSPIGRSSLMALVPDFGTRFSLAAMGLYDEPTRTGVPYYFQVDTNPVPLTDFLIAVDDDPLNANTTYTSIFANVQTPAVAYNRNQGVYLAQNIFPVTQPTARWISIEWKGASADDALKVYSYFMAYRQFR